MRFSNNIQVMLYNELYAMSYLIHLKHPIADGLAYEI